MINWLKIIISRLKHGYEIADNCYLVSGGRDGLVVSCGDRKARVYMERLRGKPDRVIYKDAEPKWLPPYENERISNEQYSFILKALVKHFEELGEVVELQ